MTNEQALADRLAVLEGEREIANLMGTYARLVDTGPDADAIADLFTEDGVYESFGHLGDDNRRQAPMQGREAIRATFQALPQMMSWAVHYLANPEIRVAPDARTGEGRWLAYELANVEREDGRLPLVMAAQYHNDFVRTPDGWRIQRIRFGDLRAFPYAEGFAHTRYISMFDGHVVKD